MPRNGVEFHRPLYIALGGIAKSVAVDLAVECLLAYGATQAIVNAGGDIRIQGKDAEPIRVSAESSDEREPVLEVWDGKLASSSGHLHQRLYRGQVYGPHVDGIHRSPAPAHRFVCVVTERCIVADALNKVVMAQGTKSATVLRHF